MPTGPVHNTGAEHLRTEAENGGYDVESCNVYEVSIKISGTRKRLDVYHPGNDDLPPFYGVVRYTSSEGSLGALLRRKEGFDIKQLHTITEAEVEAIYSKEDIRYMDATYRLRRKYFKEVEKRKKKDLQLDRIGDRVNRTVDRLRAYVNRLEKSKQIHPYTKEEIVKVLEVFGNKFTQATTRKRLVKLEYVESGLRGQRIPKGAVVPQYIEDVLSTMEKMLGLRRNILQGGGVQICTPWGHVLASWYDRLNLFTLRPIEGMVGLPRNDPRLVRLRSDDPRQLRFRKNHNVRLTKRIGGYATKSAKHEDEYYARPEYNRPREQCEFGHKFIKGFKRSNKDLIEHAIWVCELYLENLEK